MSRVKLFLADPHEVVRRGIQSTIEQTSDFVVVGEADCVGAAIPRIQSSRPDIVITELEFRDGGTRDFCPSLLPDQPPWRLVIYTAAMDSAQLFSGINSGASGFVMKHSPTAVLVAALRQVSDGGEYLDKLATPVLLEGLRRPTDTAAPDPLAGFTPREIQMLSLISSGRTNGEIASAMCLSEKTIKNYVSALLTKTGVARRTQLASLSAQLGLAHAGQTEAIRNR